MSEKLQKFYKSREWEEFRVRLIAERTLPDGRLLDEVTGEVLLRKYDVILHHVEELTDENVDDVTIALNPDNIKIVSFKTHNRLHKRYGEGAVSRKGTVQHKVYVVWGSPCCGKQEWVDSVADDGDIIVDIDRLWGAVRWNGSDDDKPFGCKSVVFKLWRDLIDMIKVRYGSWENAYVIMGGALAADRERMEKDLNADRLVYIEKDKESCIEEARRRGGDWEQWETDWWEKYSPPTPTGW